MNLTQHQIELLERIQSKILRGDIKNISILTRKTPEYVGKVLSCLTTHYNENIISEAVRIIATREQATKNNLKILNAN